MGEHGIEEVLARAGWLRVADRLLAGVVHDLNGRVTSLGGIVQLLKLDDDASMVPFLEEEVSRLGSSVGAVALLVGDPEFEPETVALDELFPPLLDLHRRHRGLESVETRYRGGELPAVEVRWGLLSRGLLLALAVAGWQASGRGRELGVRTTRLDGGAGGGLRVEIEAAGVADEGSAGGLPDVEVSLEALRELMSAVPAGLDVRDERDAYHLTVRLPRR